MFHRMKKQKHFIILSLLTIMIFATPSHVQASDKNSSVNFKWDSTNGTLTISGSGNMETYEYEEQPWYQYKNSVKKVIVEEGVTSISEAAFYAFYKITDIEIAGSVQVIESGAFADCFNLTTITLNEGIKTIDDYAFQSTAIESITLPASVSEFNAPLVFFDIGTLATITINQNNQSYCSENNIIYNKSKTELLFYPTSKKDTTFSIPSTVTSIGANAMRDNYYIKNIILHEKVKELGDWCFYNDTSLETFTIPNTVTSVGSGILESCTSLKSVNIGSGIKSTSYRMFSDCTALTDVHFESGIEEIDLRTFYNCISLKNINFPNGLKKIYVYAFYNCKNLGQITLPDTIDYIQSGAFANCTNINYNIPKGLKKLDNGDYKKVYEVKITGEYNYENAYEVLQIVNAERRNAGLNELTLDKDLLASAMKRSAEIAFSFDHTRPNGTSCFSISVKADGENIAAGNSTASGTMNQWMNSSGHRANILDSSYQSIGIGCFQFNGRTYWVQLFGDGNADTLTQRLSNRTITETIQIEEELAVFFSKDMLPGSIFVGEHTAITLLTMNSGWTSVYVPVNSNSFDWSSSNTTVATVDTSGKVTGKKAGTCVITAKYKDTNDVAFSWNVTCKNGNQIVNNTDTPKIKVSKAKISNIKKVNKKKVRLQFKKMLGIKGFEIKYSTNKKFKASKTKTKRTKKTSYTISKLKKKKTYYFKVRAYVLDSQGKKVYGKYSKVKKIKLS